LVLKCELDSRKSPSWHDVDGLPAAVAKEDASCVDDLPERLRLAAAGRKEEPIQLDDFALA
jgi:hypothetical protein